jgi:hypothetical protein
LLRNEDEVDEAGQLVDIAVESLIFEIKHVCCHVLSTIDIVLVIVHELCDGITIECTLIGARWR